jgi:hypothetical protein
LLLSLPEVTIYDKNSKRWKMHPNPGKGVMKLYPMMRRGRIQDLDRSFDLEFWQNQEPQTRFAAAWELIIHAWRAKGRDVRQLRLQRSVETFQRQQR